MKYNVDVYWTVARAVTVEADSEDEAAEIAQTMAEDGDIVPPDFENVYVETFTDYQPDDESGLADGGKPINKKPNEPR